MKFVVLMAGCVLLAGGGSVLLKHGLTLSGGFVIGEAGSMAALLRLARTWPLPCGVTCYGAAMLMWLRLLSQYELSYLYPLFVSSAFAFVLGLSWVFLREPMSPLRLLGVALMCLGIVLASRG